MSFKCELCELEFSRKDHLQRHVKTVHSSKQIKCELCDLEFKGPETYENCSFLKTVKV